MSSSAPYLSAVLLTILSLSATLYGQSTAKPTARGSRGSVSGRVTIKERGVPGVGIGLRKGDGFMPFEPFQKATTDQDGYYRFSNLAAGSYSITASAPAFVAEAKDSGRFKNVLVGDDENVEGINFSLLRGGVITGRVTDADGHPVIEQQVNIYLAESFEQRTNQTQRQQIYAAGGSQTDDRGIFRVFGLTPGRYKVAAGRSDDEQNVTYNQSRNISYKQVFYPDATDPAKATVVEVSEGSEANNIDLTLGRVVQTFSGSGQLVTAEDGQPVPNVRFNLQRLIGQRVEYMNSFAMANSRGDFVVEGLVPGKYSVLLFGGQNDLRIEPFSFDIVDHDVTGLVVKLSKGVSVSGVVVLENDDKDVFARLVKLTLRGYGMVSTAGGATVGSSSSSTLGPDGSFHLSGLAPGTINMMFSEFGSPYPPKGFTITRIERDGVISTRGLEIKEGEQVAGVRIVVSYGSGTIRGMVTLDSGPLPQRGRISIRLTKPGEQFSNLRPALIDERGHFLMEGLPAGTYELQMFLNVTGQTPRPVKREVTVQDGQVTDVTINIESTETPKP